MKEQDQDFQKRLDRIQSPTDCQKMLVAAKQLALYQRMKYLLKEDRSGRI